MSDKYICMKCKCSGAKSLLPFKIIEDRNGEGVKFKGQLCERCYKEFFETTNAPAPTTKEEKESNTNENDDTTDSE